MINYETLLKAEATRRNWEPLQVDMFESWREGVANVESGNDPARLQGDDEKGYGRGKYQYEVARGEGSGTNATAINRLHKFLSRWDLTFNSLPEGDQEILRSADPDFAKLSEDTQDILFLADKSEAPETSLDALTSGSISPAEAWADWHWKGSKEKRGDKLKQWKRNAQYQAPQVVSAKELEGDTDTWYEEIWDEVTDTAEETWADVKEWWKKL